MFKVVHVTWVDSDAVNEWTPIKEVDGKMQPTHSVGLLVHQDAECYVLSTSFDATTSSINAFIRIPSRAVTSARILCSLNLG